MIIFSLGSLDRGLLLLCLHVLFHPLHDVDLQVLVLLLKIRRVDYIVAAAFSVAPNSLI